MIGDLNMKKILVIILISFIAILSVLLLFQINTSSIGTEIDGKYINNNFNNTIVGASEVVRQNNVIYYYYQPDGEHIKNGLYQISKVKTNRIYHPNVFSLKDPSNIYMQSSENEILVGSINDTPSGVNLEENKKNYVVALDQSDNIFYNTTYLDDFKDKINYYYLIGKEIYFATDNYIFFYSNGNYTKLLNVDEIYRYNDYHNNPGFNGWYLANKKIYYFSSSDGSFCSYDIISKITDKIFNQAYILSKTKTKSIDELNELFFIFDGKLLLTVSNTVFTSDITTYKYYTLDLDNLNVDFIAENSFSEDFSINLYDDILYLGSDINGLRAINLNNNQIHSLTQNQSSNIYILDDKYIYYIDRSQSLYRITIDGKSEERIFG